MFYRYEIESGGEYPHTGILCGLDDLFDDFNDKLFKAIGYFEDSLKAPKGFGSNGNITKCYFTNQGNKKFKKAIRIIKKEINKIGINIIKLSLDETIVDTVYYRDKYQVVIDEKYIDQSIKEIYN